MNEPLDPETRSVLEAEKPISPAPPEVRARVLASVMARIGTLPPDGGGGGASAGPSTRSAATWLRIAGAFAVGGIVGATAMRTLSPPERVFVERPLPPAASATVSPPAAEPGSSSVPVESLPVTQRTAPPRAEPEPVIGDQLAAERALLDVARARIASGEGQAALDAVTRHDEQFPRGLLTEEREALRIRALIMAGHPDEARARGKRFQEQYPSSLSLRAVNAALDSIR
jgi:hypothetical protein